MFFLRNSLWMKELRPGISKIGFLVKNFPYSLIPSSKLANPGQNIKIIVDLFLIFNITVRILKQRFLVFSCGPGGFRSSRRLVGTNFHLSWYLSDVVVTS